MCVNGTSDLGILRGNDPVRPGGGVNSTSDLEILRGNDPVRPGGM